MIDIFFTCTVIVLTVVAVVGVLDRKLDREQIARD